MRTEDNNKDFEAWYGSMSWDEKVPPMFTTSSFIESRAREAFNAGQESIRKELAEVRAELAAAREALVHLGEYWNGDNNEKAMLDACENTVDVCRAFLSTPSADKVQAVLQEAQNEADSHSDFDVSDCACYCGLCEAIRALREKG